MLPNHRRAVVVAIVALSLAFSLMTAREGMGDSIRLPEQRLFLSTAAGVMKEFRAAHGTYPREWWQLNIDFCYEGSYLATEPGVRPGVRPTKGDGNRWRPKRCVDTYVIRSADADHFLIQALRPDGVAEFEIDQSLSEPRRLVAREAKRGEWDVVPLLDQNEKGDWTLLILAKYDGKNAVDVPKAEMPGQWVCAAKFCAIRADGHGQPLTQAPPATVQPSGAVRVEPGDRSQAVVLLRDRFPSLAMDLKTTSVVVFWTIKISSSIRAGGWVEVPQDGHKGREQNFDYLQ
jgi:hypothetical protein